METLSGFCLFCANPQTIDDSRALRCGHLFHEKCIDDWLQQSQRCPICRKVGEDHDEPIQLFRPSFITRKITMPQADSPNTEIDPFLEYKSLEELKTQTLNKMQKLWPPETFSTMNAAKVFCIAEKSHSLCQRALKQKLYMDCYAFSFRTGYLLREMQKTEDFNLYYRNHECSVSSLWNSNDKIYHTIEEALEPIYECRTYSKTEISDALEIYCGDFQASESTPNKLESKKFNFFTSL